MNPSEQPGAYARMMDEYSKMAAAYDASWSTYLKASAAETIKRLNLHRADQLLDVGCGTGVLLEQLSLTHPIAQLAGIDPAPQMLAIARQRLPSVDLQAGWAERLPFEAEQFDAVILCSVFHYIRNPVAGLCEIRRILRPGGRLVITDWCYDYLTCRACGLYLRLTHRAFFKIYRARELAGLLTDAGYNLNTIDRYKIGWLWGLMTAVGTKNAG